MADILTQQEKAARLVTFLRKQAGISFAWGIADCGLFLADWIISALDKPDPAEAYRGRYDSAETCEAIIGLAGLAALVDEIARNANLSSTDAPVDGDVAVVALPSGDTCAVMTRGSWAFRTPTGLVWSKITPGRVLKSWRVFPDA